MTTGGNYTCPSCNKPFKKAKKSHCPHCGILLLHRNGWINHKMTHWYELPNTQKNLEEVRKGTEELSEIYPGTRPFVTQQQITDGIKHVAKVVDETKKNIKYPIRLTPTDQIPIVIQTSETEYDVYYERIYYTGMVYCPNCGGAAFQNQNLVGTMEHKCTNAIRDGGRCKAVTSYHFSPQNLVLENNA